MGHTLWSTRGRQRSRRMSMSLLAGWSTMSSPRSRPTLPCKPRSTGPLQRSEPGTRIRLTYTSSGFSTNQVTVTWLKNKHELPKPQTSVRRSGHTYNVTSSVLVLLTDDDVLSHVVFDAVFPENHWPGPVPPGSPCSDSVPVFHLLQLGGCYLPRAEILSTKRAPHLARGLPYTQRH
uniref:Immunoglobulin C1-set domain-containing protein n=1 Tax=Saimiri boliviensis boliviensis TaxID=39432 RepID=A0A2K6SU87_SAIBB